MFEAESEVMASLSDLKEMERELNSSGSDIYLGSTSFEAAGEDDATHGDDEESPDTDSNNDSGTVRLLSYWVE